MKPNLNLKGTLTVANFAALVAVAVMILVPVKSAQALIMHSETITPESAYLEYASMFPEVGWLGKVEDGTTTFRGNIVLVAPNWGLTAAHVLLEDSNNPNSLFEGYRAGFTDNFFVDSGVNQFAAEVQIIPGYRDIGDGPDLALVRFPDAFSIEPADLYEGDFQIGDELSMVGFGEGGTVATGPKPIDGKKRAGVTLVSSIDNPLGYIDGEFRGPGESGFRDIGIQARFGDSGGGGFFNVGDDFLLSSIISFGNIFPGYGADSDLTFLTSENRAWINQMIGRTEVPEPASAPCFC